MHTNEDNIITTSPEDEDLMLPEGYGADDDIFADPSANADKQADESADAAAEEDSKGDEAEESPTTENESANDVNGKDDADAPTTAQDAPTTEQEKAEVAANKLKFRAKYNSEEKDVELNESELPGIWQKAQHHDKMQRQYTEQQALLSDLELLAKRLGYANAKEMSQKAAAAYMDAEVKSLMDSEGVSERVAKAIVEQEMAQKSAAPKEEAVKSDAPAKRNPKAEVDELLSARPDLYGKPLPQEVLVAAQAGKNLLLAYTEFESRQKEAEAKKAKQENDVLKQNAANAAKAPVKSVTAGGTTGHKDGEDDFMKGFNSDY